MSAEIMKKTFAKSYFKKFHASSPFGDKAFTDGSAYVILQIIPLNDSEFLAEIIGKKDYDEARTHVISDISVYTDEGKMLL